MKYGPNMWMLRSVKRVNTQPGPRGNLLSLIYEFIAMWTFIVIVKLTTLQLQFRNAYSSFERWDNSESDWFGKATARVIPKHVFERMDWILFKKHEVKNELVTSRPLCTLCSYHLKLCIIFDWIIVHAPVMLAKCVHVYLNEG